MSKVSLRGGQERPLPSYGATQTTHFNSDISSNSGSQSSNDHVYSVSEDIAEKHLAISVEGGKPRVTDQADPFLSFHDVTYEVNTGRFGIGGRKVVLKSVSGYMPRGLNAIMGPTGSGKTSLLDILADRKGTAGIGGVVLVNGGRQPKNFKCMSGYVVQDDTIMGTLTVRENLHFSAALRLPSKTSWQQRKDRVDKVIDELNLRSCANTKIGTEFIRGVSGGERKRTNIGMEFIIEPQVLFLDEPTTGLDANTAVAVVRLLKQVTARKNQVVIMSIHQPRYSIFKLFDSLTLLSVGNEVYHGPARHALSYFDNLGFTCEEHENPADFFLDVLILCEQEEPAIEEGSDDSSAPLVQPLNLANCYKQSELHRQAAEKLHPLLDSLHERDRQHGSRKQTMVAKYATTFIWQLLVVGMRSVINLVRSPQAALSQVMVMLIYSIIVGALYFQLDKKDLTLQTVINDRFGVFFFIILNQVFSNLSALDVFIRQKAVFVYENSNGFYRVSTFFLAKVFSDLIPTRIFPLIPYCCIIYFMVGFQLSVSKFFTFFLTLTLTSTASTSIAFAISSPLTVTAVANLFTALTFVLQMLFGGFLIALDSLPVYLFWVKYLSIFRYALEALTINEIAGQLYNVTCPNNTIVLDGFSITEESICTVSGTEALIERGFETSTEWLWYDEIALAAITLVCLSITYVNLRMVKKSK